jgi:hypothetical protein
MPDDPLGVDVPTPGPGSRQAAPPERDDRWRICGYLDEFARCGPRLAHPRAMHRADAIAGFVSSQQGELAAAGLPVDRRAELILCAASLRCAVAEHRWARARVAGARIAATLDAYPPAVEARECSAGGPAGESPGPHARELRWPWSSRNTEGITLGEAVAAARARQSMRTESDAPAG